MFARNPFFFSKTFHCSQGEHTAYPEAATAECVHWKFSASGYRVGECYLNVRFGFKMGIKTIQNALHRAYVLFSKNWWDRVIFAIYKLLKYLKIARHSVGKSGQKL